MTSRTIKLGGAGLVAAVLMLSAGCQGWTSDVAGRVAMKGKPVVMGSVVLFPDKGQPIIAPIDAEGRYVAHGVPGDSEVRVTICSPDPTADLTDLPAGPDGDQDRAVLRERKKSWIPVPSRYSDPGRSQLSFVATDPSFTFDIDLKP